MERGELWPGDDLLDAIATILGLPEVVWGPRDQARPALVRIHAHLVIAVFSKALITARPVMGRSTDLGVLQSTRLGKEGDDDFADFFPFGVLVVHEAQMLSVASWGELDQWRHRQLEGVRTELVGHWQGRIGLIAEALAQQSHLTSFFVAEPNLPDSADLDDVAVGVIEEPLGTASLRAHAEDVSSGRPFMSEHVMNGDRACIFGRFPHHVGWAKGSNAALCDFTPASIHARQLLRLEVQMQALRCYAREFATLRRAPVPAFDHSFLRRGVLRLSRPRADVRRSEAVLRDAVVRSSGLNEYVRKQLADGPT